LVRVTPTFQARRHVTALPGWRAASRRRPGLRDCSLIVPTAGRRDEVERLLDALLALPDAPGEVVVVDADPAHELGVALRRWVARDSAPFALVYAASPPGLTRQRNIGVDLSTRDFIFFLDPDALPLPGYFSAVRRVFDLDQARAIGGVTGVIVNEAQGRARDLLLYSSSGAWTPRTYRYPFSGLRRVDVLPGCGTAWRREVFDAHRFSCFFREHADGEDIELSLRAGRFWTLLCCGDARIQGVPRARPPAPGYDAGRARIRYRHLIWTRHASRPGPRNTARFWCNVLLDAAAAAGQFCLCPWQPAHLSHTAGILSGLAACLTDPPRFVEPPARREYALIAERPHLAAQTAN
jgi:glycosyltransferase involved in cell wall biosynthesis